ncbi:hypothetical protein BDV59DRAFT_191567 [Aspergillus ambiguus]|uniref:uncharacterized protein n=1 Tax=Aspergillus ambiguus TaxID=176160 RepID=UPI003CCD415A
MILTAFSILARLGVIASAIIVLGLNAKFIYNAIWTSELMIYIEVLAGVTVFAALIPPYPNFLYDLIAGLAWTLAAIFALIIQFFESTCYGFQLHADINCETYKAGTAFAFIAAISWLGCAAFKEFEDAKATDSTERKRVNILYAAPAFGQYLLERVPIPAINITLLDPTNDTIQFSVLSHVRVPDTFTIGLDPMNVSFFLPDTAPDIIPFATVELPKLTYHSNQPITVENQRLKLGDLEQFGRLVDRVAYNPTFTVAGKGRAKVTFGAIHTWVDLYKEVELTGFNHFPDLEILKFGIQEPDADGYNVAGKAILENPSPASVTLGNVTLGILIANTTLGEALVEVKNVVPGNNTFTVKGKLNTDVVEKNIDDIIKVEIPYLKDEMIWASATGISVVYHGQHLPYWEQAFSSVVVSATRPVKPLVQDLVNSGVSVLLGSDISGEFLPSIVNTLTETILGTIKTLPDTDYDQYSEAIGEVAKLALELLKTLGFI